MQELSTPFIVTKSATRREVRLRGYLKSTRGEDTREAGVHISSESSAGEVYIYVYIVYSTHKYLLYKCLHF